MANVLVGILIIVAVVSTARAIVEMTSSNPDSGTVITSWFQVGLIVFVIVINTFIGVKQALSRCKRYKRRSPASYCSQRFSPRRRDFSQLRGLRTR